MRFRDFITDAAQAARAMISNPPQGWRDGFGKAGPEGDLAAVLHYAERGFPRGGKSLAIQAPHRTSPVYEELMSRAKELEGEGRLTIQSDGMGYVYIGDPSHVREAMRVTNRRKPGLMADDEQHRAIGSLLGYSPDAIEEFIGRTRSANGGLALN